MARYAIVDKGVVTNVAEGNAEWAAETGAVQSDEAQIGWLYDGKVFTDPTPPPEPPPPRVPATISYRQLVLAMFATGAIDATEAQAMALRTMPAFLEQIIAALPPQDQVGIRITLSTMTEADRANPFVDQIAAVMGKGPADVDDFFRLAATL